MQYAVADLHSKILETRPQILQFHRVFGEIRKNRMLAPPPRENPGSATEYEYYDGVETVIRSV